MAEQPGAAAPRWHGGKGPEAQGPRRKWGLVVGLLLGVLALAGAIAAWLLHPKPFEPPTFLALWVDQYPDPRLPVNRWAHKDREALRGVWGASDDAFTSQERALFRQE